MLHVFRSLPLTADARTSRNVSLFSKDQGATVYTWEKSNSRSPTLTKNSQWIKFALLKDRVSIFRKFDYLLFVLWIAYKVLVSCKKNDTCIFMDLETIALAYPVARLKGCKIVFDVVDPFSQTKINKQWLSYKVDALELWYINHSDFVLFPHPSRKKYYTDRINADIKNTKTLIIENVPYFDLSHKNSSLYDSLKQFRDQNKHKIVIGYFGTLDSDSRGLEYLIEFCKFNNSKVALLIAGQGKLNDAFEKIVSDNIYYVGSFSQNDLPALYRCVDFTWAYYSSNVELHKYAAPNKYYEHLAFQTPIITSRIIPQATDIENNRSGIFVSCEKDTTPFINFLNELEKYISNLDDNKKYFRDVWNNKFSYYYNVDKNYSSLFEI